MRTITPATAPYHFAPLESVIMRAERRDKEARKLLREQSVGLLQSMNEWGIEGMEAEFNGSGDDGEVERAWLVRFDEEATEKLRQTIEGGGFLQVPHEVWKEIDDEQAFFSSMAPSEFPLGEEDGCEAPSAEVVEGLKTAMTEFTYAALASNRPGWEIDDGAYGTLLITAKGRVTCEFTQRYTAEEDNSFEYQHKDEDDE
jgi:hypothetical protein